MAPVKAPFSWPKSSLPNRPRGMPEQFNLRRGRACPGAGFRLLQNGLQALAFTADFFEVVLCAQLFFQIAFLLFQLAAELNNPAVAVVDLDGPGDLASLLNEHFDLALVERGLLPATYEQGCEHLP